MNWLPPLKNSGHRPAIFLLTNDYSYASLYIRLGSRCTQVMYDARWSEKGAAAVESEPNELFKYPKAEESSPPISRNKAATFQ